LNKFKEEELRISSHHSENSDSSSHKSEKQGKKAIKPSENTINEHLLSE